MATIRPDWAESSALMKDYYDHLWGFSVHDDRFLFEMLSLELFQAGLSWEIIWKRRNAFERAFDHFDIDQVAAYSQKDVERLMADEGIIRNQLKIKAVINNARVVKQLAAGGQSFDDYVWSFVDHQVQRYELKPGEALPAQTILSREISRKMKKDGFKFVGPTIIYSYLTAVGLVNARC